MEGHDITPLQAGKVYDRLRPMFHYLAELQERMEQRQFYGDDRLYLEVRTARYALQLLAKDFHAIACHNYGVRQSSQDKSG